MVTNLHVVNGGRYYADPPGGGDGYLLHQRASSKPPDFDLAVLRRRSAGKADPISTDQETGAGQRSGAIAAPWGWFNSVSDGIIQLSDMEKVSMIRSPPPSPTASSAEALLNSMGIYRPDHRRFYDDGQNLNVAVGDSRRSPGSSETGLTSLFMGPRQPSSFALCSTARSRVRERGCAECAESGGGSVLQPTTNSISTGVPSGGAPIPTAARACGPAPTEDLLRVGARAVDHLGWRQPPGVAVYIAVTLGSADPVQIADLLLQPARAWRWLDGATVASSTKFSWCTRPSSFCRAFALAADIGTPSKTTHRTLGGRALDSGAHSQVRPIRASNPSL